LIQRFVDYIPLAIEHELNQTLSDNIRNVLIQTLSEGSQDGCVVLADLLNEDPATASRRIDLESRINRLQKIMAELDRFEHLESPEVKDIEVNLANGRSTPRSTICDWPTLSPSRSQSFCSRSRSPPLRRGRPGHGHVGSEESPTPYLQRHVLPSEVHSWDEGMFAGTGTANMLAAEDQKMKKKCK